MSGHNTGAAALGIVTTRGTSNANARGSVLDRYRRRVYLVQTYRADRDLYRVTRLSGFVEVVAWPGAMVEMNTEAWVEAGATVEPLSACRCYRCGDLLTVDTVTVDRIVPGCKGGTYRRSNIRPACGMCNSETGAALRR